MTSDESSHDPSKPKGAAEHPHKCSDKTQSQVARTEFYIPQSIIDKYNANQKDSRTDSKLHLLLAFLTLIAVSIYAYLAYRQWRAIERQADLTQESFVAIQRAFVVMGPLKIESVVDRCLRPGCVSTQTDEYWRFTPVMQNSGTTPTRGLEFSARFWFVIMPKTPVMLMNEYQTLTLGVAPPKVGLPDPDDDFRNFKRDRAILGPRAEAPVGAIEVPKTYFDSLVGFKKPPLAIYGVIRYRDIFRSSPVHVTKYCYSISVWNPSQSRQPNYTTCRRWNCIDDDCVREKQEYEALLRKASQSGNTNSAGTPKEGP